jgi:hypothetical protein
VCSGEYLTVFGSDPYLTANHILQPKNKRVEGSETKTAQWQTMTLTCKRCTILLQSGLILLPFPAAATVGDPFPAAATVGDMGELGD